MKDPIQNSGKKPTRLSINLAEAQRKTRPDSLIFASHQVRERPKKPSRRGSKTAKNRDISDVRDSKLDIIDEERDKKKKITPLRDANASLLRAASETYSKPHTQKLSRHDSGEK